MKIEQPSVIDDSKIKNGFYDAPTVCVIFGQRDFLYNVADAFCMAENMILAAPTTRAWKASWLAGAIMSMKRRWPRTALSRHTASADRKNC